ncbi:VOC family protein [Fimbriimonas ginsengisoli]|uniref:Glyoxalase/bleomycin resistance protein/dioxygenase n=1 Tax=Fimbriimonas ginsengisoli Gsoil 348 TaxID=661478 RepID=A0A068NX92_FIMGI|nr:VOC family protein [Fimbriimonas ginsengisoli]AIE86249.1 glyoxalase/bleomycin resistance protein/dioxygenase [Fimbriimonas ginsengisoli Gsoil 348]
MVQGLNTLICQISDMDRAVAFYRDVLGLSPRLVTPYWSDFMLGPIRLGLHPKFRGEASGGGWIVGVEVADLKALRTRLSEAGYPTDHPYHETPLGVVVDFADPDGNPLQAIQLGTKMSDFA